MPDHLSHIDYQMLTKKFKVGDKVQVIEPRGQGTMAPIGVVTAVHPGIGFVDVQFPTTHARVSPEELHLAESKEEVGDTGADPAVFDRDYEDFEHVASLYMDRVATLHRDAHHFRAKGIGEMDAYQMLFRHHHSRYSDHEVKSAVTAAYSDGQTKDAMYWKEKGRQYCPSKAEISSGCFHCPRCKTEMKKTVYQKHTKLYACPECLFLITPSDILDSMDKEDRDEAEKSLGWSPQITPPSKAFNEWL